jgi:hypothetical protein
MTRVLWLIFALIGFAPGAIAGPVESSLRPVARDTAAVAAHLAAIPEARWDRLPDGERWSRGVLTALRSHASDLPEFVPEDIDAWCPAYASGTRAEREAFWVGLVSSLAYHESTHRPQAVGGGGRWIGLTQIYPPTAQHFGCRARSAGALKDPVANLSCAMRIMANTVTRDGVVAAGKRGVAADWGPFHSTRKREDMRDWVRSQPYCAEREASLSIFRQR